VNEAHLAAVRAVDQATAFQAPNRLVERETYYLFDWLLKMSSN
jgi:hypothetical protein